jgi:hydroxylamine reductase
MFCYQCEQTAKGEGCTVRGVCGKSAEVAALQDVLIHSLKGLSLYAVEARRLKVLDNETSRFTCEALFSTLTNVNFDPERFVGLIQGSVRRRKELKKRVADAGGKTDFTAAAASFEPPAGLAELIALGDFVGLRSEPEKDPDVVSLKHTTLFGLKGVAAYADHAAILGEEDDAVYAFIHEALAAMTDPTHTLDEWVGLAMKCGQTNIRAMELLDAGNTGRYGHPVPTSVPLGAKKGKAIAISGHDLLDLDLLLKQTEGKGITVYTHGEMLPTHGYPGLKKYPHFYGHYGTAWQNQVKEFALFPGAILMTTNCIQKPRETYQDNLFTTGLVGYESVRHIADKNFTPVIEKALAMPGFPEDTDKGSVMVGFGRNAVLSVADKVLGAVGSGAIKHFFLVAGCDGAKPGRDYYTEFVEKTPPDTVVLTLACGKFRFFDKKLGEIGGLPRLLDVGQCNDAYSAVKIAMALAEALGTDVNSLPLSLVLSWYEQKAAAILLSLLALGIKDIRLGPSLPAFISPNVLNLLVKQFNIMPITTPDQDLQAILGQAAG